MMGMMTTYPTDYRTGTFQLVFEYTGTADHTDNAES